MSLKKTGQYLCDLEKKNNSQIYRDITHKVKTTLIYWTPTELTPLLCGRYSQNLNQAADWRKAFANHKSSKSTEIWKVVSRLNKNNSIFLNR